MQKRVGKGKKNTHLCEIVQERGKETVQYLSALTEKQQWQQSLQLI